MSQYLLLVYEPEVDAAEQAEREKILPLLLELHDSLREAGAARVGRAAAYHRERDVGPPARRRDRDRRRPVCGDEGGVGRRLHRPRGRAESFHEPHEQDVN